MSLSDLIAPRHPAAVRAASRMPLLQRLRAAVQKPPMPNRYVAPRLRTLDAVLFTLRGYRVAWTEPLVDYDCNGPFTTSVLVQVLMHGEALHEPGFVELPMVLPGEVHRVASWLQGARAVGWRFAWWQAKRELQWVVQVRQSRRAPAWRT